MLFPRNAAISTKVLVGFGVVLTLLLLIAATGAYSLIRADAAFQEYRSLALQTNAYGRIQANMLMTRLFAKSFVLDASEESVRGVKERAQTTIQMIEEARGLTSSPQRLDTLDELDADLRTYVTDFETVTRRQAERSALVREQLDLAGPETEQNLSAVMCSAHDDGDIEAAYRGGMALRHLLLGRLYTHRFLIQNDAASYERALAAFEDLEKAQTELEASLEDPKRQELATKARASYEAYARAMTRVHDVITERNEIIREDLDRIGPAVAASVEALKLSAKSEQDRLGPQVEASMDRAVTLSVVLSIAAILAGILAALWIGRAIAGQVSDITGRLEGFAEKLLSDAHEQQAGAAEQSSAVEETRQTFQGLLASSASLNRVGGEVLENAEIGQQSAQRISGRIGELSSHSKQITDILSIVEEIANKSEILALNAALEGTKAGEAGRGFSLVAQQMQRLAEQVMDSAKKIGTLTRDISRASGAAVLAAEESEKVSRLTTASAREIAEAVDHQQSSAEQIGIAMDEISTVARRSVDAARYVVGSTDDLLALAKELRRLAGAKSQPPDRRPQGS